MKYYLRLKFAIVIYYCLIFFILVILLKFIFDFCVMNTESQKTNKAIIHEYNKYLIKPRIQIESNGFEYIKANQGYFDGKNYIFENVIMEGDFGDATAGKLIINEAKTNFKFTIKPKFIIYLNNFQ